MLDTSSHGAILNTSREEDNMNSQEAINENFIPYPYTFPAIKFVVNEEENMNKFVDETGEMLNDIAMNGFLDDQFGSVTEDGIWLGLILEHKAIIQENSQGFFTYEIFDSEDDAQKAYTYMTQHNWEF